MARVYEQAYVGSKLVPLEEAQVSVTSSAVLYGLSVYTVLPVCVTAKGLVAFRVGEHFERLVNSARIIGIDTFEKEWDRARFEKVLKEVVAANDITQDVFARVTVHVTEPVAGTRSRGLKTDVSIFIYDATPILPQTGARVKTSVWRRIPDYSIPSRAKVNGAYVNSVLAKQDALDSGYDDCVFLDVVGHVCELSAANIFIVRDGALITPGTSSDILEGINRRTLLQVANEMGLKAIERTIDLTELYVADEVFACGTSAFVAPIIEIDKRVVGDGKMGSITKRLQEKHAQLLRGGDSAHTDWLTIIA